MPYWSSPALTLRTVEYSETSLIVTLLTRARGRTGALAKGARRRESRFQGEIEVATLADVVVFEGKDPLKLKTLSEIAITDTLRGARRTLERVYAATYVVELLREATPEGEPVPDVFDLAVATLRAIAGPGTCDGGVVIAFEARLLELLGLFPSVEACAECGEALPPGPAAWSGRLGGALCPRCRQRDPRTLEASAGAREVLDLLGRRPERAAHVRLPKAQRAELRALLDATISHTLEREMRLARHVAGM
jgi:DNA repair protein RecO (recombination protein O)